MCVMPKRLQQGSHCCREPKSASVGSCCIWLHVLYCFSEQVSRNAGFAVLQRDLPLGSHAAVAIRVLAEKPAHRGFQCSNDVVQILVWDGAEIVNRTASPHGEF